ncbi:hypothetical protein CKA32_000643 [Geitlerinema sp. FC II]|nr:hypothetical protein CKA32_000643 [Geitlerinema sp. FC II]
MFESSTPLGLNAERSRSVEIRIPYQLVSDEFTFLRCTHLALFLFQKFGNIFLVQLLALLSNPYLIPFDFHRIFWVHFKNVNL